MLKKISSIFLLGIMMIGFSSTLVQADTGAYVSLSFNSYAGSGFVDGGDNGQYYQLSKGQATLQVTSTNGGFRTELRKKLLVGSLGCGTNYISGTGNYYWNTPSTDKYFITAYDGASAFTDYYLKGRMHNH